MSTQAIHHAVLKALAPFTIPPNSTHLDIGAGNGDLIQLIRQKHQTNPRACDYTTSLMKLPDVPVDEANLNHQPLPYPDASFQIVTATEVVEHLEHYRETIREIYRVLKPGGIFILSTPNILNINSRLRFLTFGFWNLFGPLPVGNQALESTSGHINPVTWFYLAHSLMDAGFIQPTPSIDKPQRSSIGKLLLLAPAIYLGAAWARHRELHRYHTMNEANTPLVDPINSTDLLLGRTLLITTQKPQSQP